jgi:hypothetical protein
MPEQNPVIPEHILVILIKIRTSKKKIWQCQDKTRHARTTAARPEQYTAQPEKNPIMPEKIRTSYKITDVIGFL